MKSLNNKISHHDSPEKDYLSSLVDFLRTDLSIIPYFLNLHSVCFIPV